MSKIKDKNKQVERLILLLADGQTIAMGELYDLIKTDVFAYVVSKLGNKTDAEDLVEEVFVRVYKYAKQYKPQGKPLAWVITIASNLVKRHFTLSNRTVGFDEAIGDSQMIDGQEENVLNNVFLESLLKALNEKEREVIVLHVVSGLKHREIAKLLDEGLSTVLSRYNRAIKKLQGLV